MSQKNIAYHRRTLSNFRFNEGEVIKYVLARYDYRNKKPTQYNLYTEDEEFLVLSAVKNMQCTKFTILTNSCENTEQSDFFIGSLVRHDNSLYHGYSIRKYTESNGSILNVFRVVWKKNEQPIFMIPPLNVASFSKTFTEIDEMGAIQLKVEDFDLTPENYSISFSYNGKIVFSIKYKDIDEYSVMITHPLSLFQAFSFCLLFLQKNELL